MAARFRRAWTLLLLVLFCSIGPTRAGEIIDRVLAVVAGQIITQSDVQLALSLGLVKGAGSDRIAEGLRQLIDRTLVLTEVRRVFPSDPDPGEVAARVSQMRARFDSPPALVKALAEAGIDEARLRAFAADELRIRTYLNDRFAGASQPTEDETRQYLRDRQQEFTRPGLSAEELEDLARQRLADERQQRLVAEWIQELRRRVEITELTAPR